MALRITFMGTPDFSVPTLKALHRAGHEIVACYSQPPRPAGRRGLELTPSPVHRTAEELEIPVFTPASLKTSEEQSVFARHNADIAIVVAYGLLLPQPILDAPKYGCFNGHASLLPRWRGAAPIQRAIMAGDAETGMMVMKMELGLDTGPVAMEMRVPITTDITAGELHDQLAQEGAALMVEAMERLESGDITLTEQSQEGVTYASKISKDEARIDWSKPAQEVQRLIMGLSPFPGAWCEMKLGGKLQRVKVLRAEVAETSTLQVVADGLIVPCGLGSVKLTILQKAGSKAMKADEFFRGNTFDPQKNLS